MQMQIIIEKFLRSEKSHSLKLNAQERILIFILASWMGNKNECWPSYEALMKDCGMAKPTLSKSIQKLKSLGIIEVIQKRKKGEYKKSNNYRFSSSHLELENDYQVQNDEFSSSKYTNYQVQHVNSNNISNNISNNKSFFNAEAQKKDNTKKHDWAAMKNEKAHIDEHERRKKELAEDSQHSRQRRSEKDLQSGRRAIKDILTDLKR